jgi:multicomponent Na+:H+ antiporter subunit E
MRASHAAFALVLVAATYVLMLASTDPVDLATGVVVAAVLLLAFRRFVFPGVPMPAGPSLLRRAVAFPAFAFAVLRDITLGTWDVALIVLHLRPLRQPGIVAVPFGERTERGAMIGALVATLSPGELLIDVDHERRVVFLHVIDASDPDAVRRKHEHFYRRFQRNVFP